MLRTVFLVLALSVCVAFTGSARAGAGDTDARLSDSFEALRSHDLRAGRVSFALRRAVRDLCPLTGPLPGWTLHNAAQYSTRVRRQAQQHFGLVGDYPALLIVVPDGPAAAAGLQTDDTLVSVNGLRLGQSKVEGPASYRSLAIAVDTLNRALVHRSVLLIERGGEQREVVLHAPTGCAYETQVDPSPQLQASADAQRVFLTSAMVAFAADDDELAFVLGHEYAHILLGHPPDPLAAGVGSAGAAARHRTNQQELAADRLGLRLAHLARYDVRAGPRLLKRLGRARPWLNLLAAGHPALARRRREMLLEIDRLLAVPPSEGSSAL